MLRTMVGAIAVFSAGLAYAAAGPEPTKVTCTNPVNGWHWNIQIDYTLATVDSFAARISRDEISWRDPRDMGNYTLDRRSGDLSASFPSSTGGYIMQYRCALKGAQ